MAGRTVVVTDSTASLPPEVAQERGIVVVPLQVVIGATVYDEGAEGATPELVAQALKDFRPVSTSRPAPAALLEVYEKAAADGADAGAVDPPVGRHERDPRVGPAGVAGRVGAGHRGRLATGRGRHRVRRAERVRRPRRRRLGRGGRPCGARAGRPATALFYVDTLEYLRRGGRIGAAAALLGGALAVKPLLRIEDGRVANLERVRTSARALSRLEDLVVEAAGDQDVDVCVSHLANPDRAGDLAARLGDRLAANLDGREVWCGELGAVLGAHVGPGMVAACVAPRLG